MNGLSDLVDAWRQTFHASLTLAGELSPTDLAERTGCPLWTVGDIYTHLIDAETGVLADPVAGPPPVRATRPDPDRPLVDRMRDVYALRSEQMSGLTVPAEGAEPTGARQASERRLRMRVLDCWVHEQDIRVAVGRPGNLESPAGRMVHVMFRESLPHTIAGRSGAPEGSRIRFEVVAGPLPFASDILVSAGGLGRQIEADPAATPDASVRTDGITFVQLCGGRTLSGSAELRLGGDVDLARRVTTAIAVTP
jgi:uncharacterized protein (TIGR03083 family)